VIWTTTPWTIPVNQALAYGPEVDYALLRRRACRSAKHGRLPNSLIAKALIEAFENGLGDDAARR
jgi:isoleucyl-tRNA synthetase